MKRQKLFLLILSKGGREVIAKSEIMYSWIILLKI